MKLLLKYSASLLMKILFIFVSFFVFQNSIATVSVSVVNIGVNNHATNASFAESLAMGVKGAVMGSFIGGISGGIQGFRQAKILNQNGWNGKQLAARSSTSLGAARSSVRGYLKNVGNVPRNQLVKDLEGAGFKKVFDGKGMQHFQRGNWKIRLDPPQSGTPFNHMHINRGGNKNAFDIFLNPVNYKSPGAHIPIR